MDDTIEQWINQPAGSTAVLDPLMKAIAGGAEVIFAVLVVGWFVYGWWMRRRADRFGAIAAVLAAAGALGVNQIVGLFWARPRPYTAHPGVHVLLNRSSDPSFPSDHAAAAFAIALVVVLLRPRLGWIAVVAAVAVAYARVYVGLHYPGDVAGGALIGVGVALLAMGPLRIVPDKLTDLGDAILARLPGLARSLRD